MADKLTDEDWAEVLDMAQTPQFGGDDVFLELGRQRMLEAGHAEPDAQRAVNEPGASSRLRRLYPSLTVGGFNYAEEAVLGGQIDFRELMDNTERELKAIYGQENVRTTVASGKGTKTEFETRDAPGADWRPHGMGKRLRDILQKRDEEFAKEVDPTRGAPAWTRAKLGYRERPGGQANLLVEDFGPGNVYLFSTGKHAGKYAVNLDPSTTKGDWVLTDEEGPSWGDLADWMGPATRIAPSLIGGYIGARAGHPVAGGMIGDVAGELAYAGAAEAVGGESAVRPGEHVENILLGVGSGAAAELGGAGLRAARRAFGPTGAVGRQVAREAVPVTLRESVAGAAPRGVQRAAERRGIAEEFDIPMSAAQLTQGAKAIRFEDLIRTKVGGEEVFRLFDVEQAKKMGKAVDNVLKGVARESVGADAAVRQAAGAYEAIAERMIAERAKATRPMFEAATRAGETIPAANFMRVLEEEVAETAGRAVSDTDRILSRRLGKMLEDFRTTPNWTPKDLQADLSRYGKLIAGTGDLFKDLDKASSIRVAKRLFGAMQADLADAPAGAALREARDTYREMTKGINSLRRNFLSQTVRLTGNDTPELFVENFLAKSTTPTRIRKAFGLLDKQAPDAARGLRRAVLEDVLIKAEPPTKSVLARAFEETDRAIGPAQLASVILNPRHAAKLKAMLPGKDYGELKRIAQLAQAASATGAVGSQTAGRMFANSYFDAAIRASVNPREAARELGAALMSREFAIAMVDREGRDVFLKLAKPPPNIGGRAVTRLIAKLTDVINRGLEDEPTLGGFPRPGAQAPPIEPQPVTGVEGMGGPVQLRGAGGL